MSQQHQHKPLPGSPQRVSGSHSLSPIGVISHFLRPGKKISPSLNDLPPPTPPKDVDRPSQENSRFRDRLALQDVADPPHTHTSQQDFIDVDDLFHFGTLSHSNKAMDDRTGAYKKSYTVPQYQAPFTPRRSTESSVGLSPAEKARRRVESERLREAEEKEAARVEAERQARLKREKEEILRQEEEEAERRRLILQEELRQATAERLKKNKDIREAEERRAMELVEKRREEKIRRIEESKRLEQWRKEHARLAEEIANQKELARERATAERRARIASAAAQARVNPGPESIATGWVTIQTNETLRWKRRFFKLVGTTMFFYRNSKDVTVALDKIQLRGQVTGLKEWYEGFEELEAIPHSFAVQFKDGQGSWSVFSDSEEEKERLLVLLYQAAGLRD